MYRYSSWFLPGGFAIIFPAPVDPRKAGRALVACRTPAAIPGNENADGKNRSTARSLSIVKLAPPVNLSPARDSPRRSKDRFL